MVEMNRRIYNHRAHELDKRGVKLGLIVTFNGF